MSSAVLKRLGIFLWAMTPSYAGKYKTAAGAFSFNHEHGIGITPGKEDNDDPIGMGVESDGCFFGHDGGGLPACLGFG